MKKILIGLVVVVAVGGAAFYAFNSRTDTEKQEPTDYKDATYIIEGTSVTLVGGEAGTTKYFGNQAKGDLNGDDIPDLAFLLTQQPGGSGTFFYVVGAIQTPAGAYNGTHAVLLGDRIAPQSTEIRDGKVIVNYAVRAPGEPMTAEPRVGKSMVLKLNPETMQFGEVAQDFEGEADPSRMTVTMKPWTWISATYNDGRQIKPNKAGAFILRFGVDGKFTANTDCNSVGGSYTLGADKKIAFTEIFMTKMFCQGSQEEDFLQLLVNTESYHFTSKGEMVFDLKFDSGSVIFK